ncbi:MAG: hypothetical protein NVSMB38_07660 [Ktedonobacteraceae bacterium]
MARSTQATPVRRGPPFDTQASFFASYYLDSCAGTLAFTQHMGHVARHRSGYDCRRDAGVCRAALFANIYTRTHAIGPTY